MVKQLTVRAVKQTTEYANQNDQNSRKMNINFFSLSLFLKVLKISWFNMVSQLLILLCSTSAQS